MKKVFQAIGSIYLTLLISTAQADQLEDGRWHPILKCQNDSVVIDNMGVFSRGGYGTLAQVVVHDSKLVEKIRQTGISEGFVGGQWIAKSYFQYQEPGELINFNFSNIRGRLMSNNKNGFYLVIGNDILEINNCI